MQGIISNFHCTLHLSVHIINVPGIGKNILFPHLYPIFFFFFSFTVTLCVVTFPNFLYRIQPTIYLKFKILYSCYFSWSKCQVNETGFRFFFLIHMETENIYARKWRKNTGLHIEHYYIHREVQHIGLSRYINLYLLTVLTVHLLLIGLLNGRVITSPLLVLTLPFKKFWHLFLVFYITICYDFNYCPGGFQSFGALTL